MFRHKIVIFAACTILIFVAGNGRAQGQSSDSADIRPGRWALQFGIGSNFTLTSFQGSTIAVTRFVSESNAIRAGLTINGSFSDGTGLNNLAQTDSALKSASSDNTYHTINVTLAVQYLWYINPRDQIHLYLGAGPSVSFYRYSASSNAGYFPSQGIGDYIGGYYWNQWTNSNTSTQWGLGARGVAGVEWFAARWFSLRAEYNQGISYQWSTSSSNTVGVLSNPPGAPATAITGSTSGKGWLISSFGVSFGASVFF